MDGRGPQPRARVVDNPRAPSATRAYPRRLGCRHLRKTCHPCTGSTSHRRRSRIDSVDLQARASDGSSGRAASRAGARDGRSTRAGTQSPRSASTPAPSPRSGSLCQGGCRYRIGRAFWLMGNAIAPRRLPATLWSSSMRSRLSGPAGRIQCAR